MFVAKDFRKFAREALNGKWGMAVLAGFVASLLGGALMGLLYSFLTVTLKANQNVTGLAMTIFGAGVTKFIMSRISTVTTAYQYLYGLEFFRFPFAKSTTAFKYFGVLSYLAVFIALAAAFVHTENACKLDLVLKAAFLHQFLYSFDDDTGALHMA